MELDQLFFTASSFTCFCQECNTFIWNLYAIFILSSFTSFFDFLNHLKEKGVVFMI